jgi:hypothetical protein
VNCGRKNTDLIKNTSIKTVFPVLVTYAVMMYSSIILVFSIFSFIIADVLKIFGSTTWVIQINNQLLFPDPFVVTTQLGLALPKTLSNIGIIVAFWFSFFVIQLVFESGLYEYLLSYMSGYDASYFNSTRKNWKNYLVFLLWFTPIWLISAILGFYSQRFFIGLGLSPLLSSMISFVILMLPLIISIPIRFYYLDGNSFLNSCINALENIKYYIIPNLVITIPIGILYVYIFNIIHLKTNSILTLISYSPIIIITGLATWVCWSLAITFSARKYLFLKEKIITLKEVNFD